MDCTVGFCASVVASFAAEVGCAPNKLDVVAVSPWPEVAPGATLVDAAGAVPPVVVAAPNKEDAGFWVG